VLGCIRAIVMSEAAAYHQSSLRKTPELFGDETRLLLEAGEMIPADDLHQCPTSSCSGKGGL
jgi:hypothetical protein